MENGGAHISVMYKEDVAEAFRCTDTTALDIIKNSGRSFKIGRRWAMTAGDFFNMLHGMSGKKLG